MPCDTLSRTEIEKRNRQRQLDALEAALKAKTAKITALGNKINITGWSDRGDWNDVCVLRQLMHSDDFEVRRIAAQSVPAHVQKHLFGHVHH